MLLPKLQGTDHPTLTLGYPSISRSTTSIVGLDLYVHGLDEIQSSTLPIAVVIATHGRTGNHEEMDTFAQGLLGHVAHLGKGKERKREVLVVTLDQRNHGQRTVDRTANLAYDQNPRHLYDMAACIVGGCQDVSTIITFLAAYLFPHGERIIDEWIPTGISLGGNLTWRLLRQEPRISIAIPIISLPSESYLPYLRARAETMGIPFKPPIYPPSLEAFFETPPEQGIYRGKKILSMHGKDDQLVPFRAGEKDIEKVDKEVNGQGGGVFELWIQDDVGHACSTEMVKKTAEWVFRWALLAEDTARS